MSEGEPGSSVFSWPSLQLRQCPIDRRTARPNSRRVPFGSKRTVWPPPPRRSSASGCGTGGWAWASLCARQIGSNSPPMRAAIASAKRVIDRGVPRTSMPFPREHHRRTPTCLPRITTAASSRGTLSVEGSRVNGLRISQDSIGRSSNSSITSRQVASETSGSSGREIEPITSSICLPFGCQFRTPGNAPGPLVPDSTCPTPSGPRRPVASSSLLAYLSLTSSHGSEADPEPDGPPS